MRTAAGGLDHAAAVAVGLLVPVLGPDERPAAEPPLGPVDVGGRPNPAPVAWYAAGRVHLELADSEPADYTAQLDRDVAVVRDRELDPEMLAGAADELPAKHGRVPRARARVPLEQRRERRRRPLDAGARLKEPLEREQPGDVRD